MVLPVQNTQVLSRALFHTTMPMVNPKMTLAPKILWNVIRWSYRFRAAYEIQKHPDNWKYAVLAGGVTGAAETFTWVKTALQIVLIGKCIHNIVQTHYALNEEWKSLQQTFVSSFPPGTSYLSLEKKASKASSYLSAGERGFLRDQKMRFRLVVYGTKDHVFRIWRCFVRLINLYADTLEIASGSAFAIYHHTVELLAVKRKEIDRLKGNKTSLYVGLERVEEVVIPFMKNVGVDINTSKIFFKNLIETAKRGEQAVNLAERALERGRALITDVFSDNMLFPEETFRRAFAIHFTRPVEEAERQKQFRPGTSSPDFCGQSILLPSENDAGDGDLLDSKTNGVSLYDQPPPRAFQEALQ